jgi:hypothetical protein
MESDLDITTLGVLNYELNEKNKKLFLEKTADDVRDIMRRFLEITIHVSYKTFIKKIKENLIQVLKKYYESNNTIFVYIKYLSKDQSNYWIHKHITYFLKNIQQDVKIINTFNDKEVKDNDIILLADDCIYTGNQMSFSINTINNFNKKKVKLILFVPYVSKNGLDMIQESYKRNTNLNNCKFIISDHVLIEPLNNFFTDNEINKLFRYYYNLNNKGFAIYFDHKLADYLSSYASIYNGLVPNEKNLYLSKKNITDINKYDFFPLITNCENNKDEPPVSKLMDFNSYINVNNCPYPPYKKDYEKNVDKLNTHKNYLEEEPIEIEEISTTNIEKLIILIDRHFENIDNIKKHYIN